MAAGSSGRRCHPLVTQIIEREDFQVNPFWYLVGALVALPAIPLTVVGIVSRQRSKRERALARRRKNKIVL